MEAMAEMEDKLKKEHATAGTLSYPARLGCVETSNVETINLRGGNTEPCCPDKTPLNENVQRVISRLDELLIT